VLAKAEAEAEAEAVEVEVEAEAEVELPKKIKHLIFGIKFLLQEVFYLRLLLPLSLFLYLRYLRLHLALS